MNPAILILSTALLTNSAAGDVIPVGCGGAGCGTAVALPAACSGCGTCGTGVCGAGDPNPLEKKGLLASIKKRLTPAPRSCGSCGGGGLLGLGIFQGGLLGKLRDGHASAPAGCNGPSCGSTCGEAPIVIGNTTVSGCAAPPAPIVNAPAPAQAMPAAPVGEGAKPAPMPMPPAGEKKDEKKISLPAIPTVPSVPVTPASGPAASTSKPRF